MMKMNNVSVSGRKRREEKVMTEAATMGRSVTALPTQEASHHSLSSGGTFGATQASHQCVRTGGLCYRLNVVDVILNSI